MNKYLNIDFKIVLSLLDAVNIFFQFIYLSTKTRIIVVFLLIYQFIININTFNINIFRLNVIKRLRHIYFFCFFF